MSQGYATDISLVAAADLSAKQFCFVKINSSGQAAVCGLGELAIGVLQNKPLSGQTATVRIHGKSHISCGGVIAPGATIKSSAAGLALDANEAVTNTSDAGAASDALIGSHAVGVCTAKANTASGDIADMMILHLGAVPTTAA